MVGAGRWSTLPEVQLLTGIPTSELEARRARLLEFLESMSLTGCVLFDDRYVQYFTSFNFLATERPVGVAMNAAGEPRRVRARVRGRAHTGRDHVRADRVVPGVPGHRAPDAASSRDVLEDMGIGGAIGADNDGYPGILGYQGPALSEVIGGRGDAAGAADREHDGAQERGRGGADPRERPLVRARPPAAAGVQRPRLDRGPGGPPRRLRDHARHARGARPCLQRPAVVDRRRVRRLPRPGRPPQRLGARRRPQHPVRGRAGARHRDGSARSGATTPSSSGR